MAILNITRPPQYTDPWFAEIEQVWDELEAANNDLETRVSTLETTVGGDIVTSLSKSGDPQLTGDITLTQSGTIVITQVGNNLEFSGGGVSDHGALSGLGDDDHTQYLLANGTRSLSGNLSVGNHQLLNIRVENLASDPLAGNQGRLIFNTASSALKIDNGASFDVVGVTAHGSLSGLANDDHTQYLLADGSRDCTGDFTVLGQYKGDAASGVRFLSDVADLSASVAHIFDTSVELTTSGAKLLSIRNDGVEKFSIDKDGNLQISSLISNESSYILIDVDDDSTTEVFSVRHNNIAAGAADTLFEINESGEAQVVNSLRIGSLGVPTDTLDVNGTASISGDVLLGGEIQSNSNVVVRLDVDDDENAVFEIRDGLSQVLLQLNEDAELAVASKLHVGDMTAATNTFEVTGDSDFSGTITVSDSNPIRSAGDLEFQIDYDNDDDNWFRWTNGLGSTVLSLTEDGDLYTTGTIIGGSSPFKFRSSTLSNEGDKASGSITIIDNSFDVGDSVTITDPDLVAHTFIETTDFAIGVDADETALNLATAITIADIGVSASANLNVVELEANEVGTIGNQFALSEFDQATDNFTLSGANLSGGTDVATVAYELDTENEFTLEDSRLLSLKNNGVEVFAIDKDGEIVGLSKGSGRREIWQITAGNVPPSSGTFGSNLALMTALVFDASANEDIVFQVPMADNINLAFDVQVVLKYTMSTNSGDDVKLNLDYVVADLTENVDPASHDANLSITITPGAGSEILRTASFTIPASDIPSTDSVLFARLTRDATHGGDTHTGDFQLISLELAYTT